MENLNLFAVPAFEKKEHRVYVSNSIKIDTTNDDNPKGYASIEFEDEEQSKDGVIRQDKLYKKAFFEDIHSLVYRHAEKAAANDTKIKVSLLRLAIPCPPYYILDEKGKKKVDKDGNPILGAQIVLLLTENEKPETEYRRQLKRIKREGRFVEIDPDHEEGEEKDKALTGKK